MRWVIRTETYICTRLSKFNGITTKLESGTRKCQVSSIRGLRATKFGNVGVRLPGVWVSPGKCLRKTPPKGHVYNAVGLGFIVWDTMLGLPGANPRHQTVGWVCPLLASSQSARMLSTHARRQACTHTPCILSACTYTLYDASLLLLGSSSLVN